MARIGYVDGPGRIERDTRWPLSVARAFSRVDWLLLAQAGITRYALRWCWAFRWQVVVWAEREHLS